MDTTTTTASEEESWEIMGNEYNDVLRYIAPWNALMYNSKSSNLAEHGLHPRMTHAVVNMPMLFGPLALVGCGSLIRNVHDMIVVGRTKKKSRDGSSSFSFAESACRWTIVSGLLVLSCAPHQEPRFLLPVIVPLVFLYGRRVVGAGLGGIGMGSVSDKQKRRSAVVVLSLLPVLWIAFNLILYVFFGWLHQGGLLPSLLHLSDSGGNGLLGNNDDRAPARSPLSSIYYKTYMPPTFLTRGRSHRATGEHDTCHVEDICSDTTSWQQQQTELILDLKGADSSVLLEVLRKWLPCRSSNVVGDGAPGAGELPDGADSDDRFLRLVAPPAAILPLVEDELNITSPATMIWEEYSIALARVHHGHISTEDWPPFRGSIKKFMDQLTLDVYAVSCAH